MNSLREHWRLWLAMTAGWTILGLTYTFHYYAYATNYTKIFTPPPTLKEMFVWEMPYWLLWAALSPLVFRIAGHIRFDRERLWRGVLLHVAVCVALTLAHRAVYLLIGWGLHVATYRRLNSIYAVYDSNFFFNLPNGFLCYATLLVVYAIRYYRRHHEEEVKISRLETEIAQTRLQAEQARWQALQMQLQPHFLFNTLQSISNLLYVSTEAADEMLARLGDFLRLTLEHSGKQEVTLRAELGFLECYLAIMQVRFRDRLTVEMDIGPETLEAHVPNLILQPIVENAIRHGVASHVGPGHIKIRSSRRGEHLRLEVEDNGPGLCAAPGAGNQSSRGHGLKLTRERLEHLYKGSYQLLLSDVPGGGLCVTLEIPYIVRHAAPAGAAVGAERQVAAV